MLPVEQFMRDYFHHTNHVWQLAHRLSELMQPPSRVSRVFGPDAGSHDEGRLPHRPPRDQRDRQGAGAARAPPGGSAAAGRARPHGRASGSRRTRGTSSTAPRRSTRTCSRPTPRTKFLKLLDRPERLGELLRRLHELGVLEKIIPEFAHARCLLQFNQYHKYTVDEHCIRAVEEATHFAERKDALGEAYAHLQDKRMLHLALLIHDLGKGYEEDHCEVGRRIAQRTAERFELSVEDSETLEFLVHKHLVMSHLAFRRDTSQTAAGGAVCRRSRHAGAAAAARAGDVRRSGGGRAGRAQQLESRSAVRALPPHAADADAPDRRTGRGPRRRRPPRDTRIVRPGRARRSLVRAAARRAAGSVCRPPLAGGSARRACGGCARSRRAAARRGPATCRKPTRSNSSARSIKASGGRSSPAWPARSPATACKSSRPRRTRWPTACCCCATWRIEPDYPGEPPPQRLAAVCESLVASIDRDEPPTFRTVWGHEQNEANAALSNLPNEVRIDTQLSDECAIVEVFTIDRRGLLYRLARALHDLELDHPLRQDRHVPRPGGRRVLRHRARRHEAGIRTSGWRASARDSWKSSAAAFLARDSQFCATEQTDSPIRWPDPGRTRSTSSGGGRVRCGAGLRRSGRGGPCRSIGSR